MSITWDTRIPPGREDLYRRQAEADAEADRAEAAWAEANKRADRVARHRTAYDPQVKAADAEAERLLLILDRAVAVADRVYQERTAGLSGWIDCNPHLPVCPACKGTGGGPSGGVDARDSCRTCRGWGREDDGRPSVPVWHDADEHGPAAWVDPSTGREVDLLADPPKPAPKKPASPAPTTSTQGSTTMSELDVVKASLMQAITDLTEAQGPLQQGHSQAETAQQAVLRAEGSDHSNVGECLGQIARAMEQATDARQSCALAQSAAEAELARLG